jgi:hypothetical protein
LKRLGKNHGAYHGETIDIRATLEKARAAARTHGWSSEVFHSTDGFDWMALHRKASRQNPATRIYISAGIHGDEPAAPLAALRLLEENQWPANAEIFLLPCLNPVGYTRNKRGNIDGLDLNRDYRNPKAAETRAHIAWLERQPGFDLYLCLHEDWESHGFYLYEQNPDGRVSLAAKMIEAAKAVCPIDTAEIIEGRPAQGGIIRPNIDPAQRPDWPEALYLISHKARQGYTLEAPSDFELAVRVEALVKAAGTAVEALNTLKGE